ncbi:hypothetical protein BOX15_Mlig021955g1, partial [Macrostomum lignano]
LHILFNNQLEISALWKMRNYNGMEVLETHKKTPELPEKARSIIASLSLSTDDYKAIGDLMASSFEAGLKASGGPKPAVKMLCSYVTKLPAGSETGDYLALDLGGTNYRVLLVRLRGSDQEPEILEDVYAVPQELMLGDGAALFTFIAGTLRDFLQANQLSAGPDGERLKLGFTFSFPVEQHGLSSGSLIMWTKGFAAKGVVGHDVCKLLQEAIDKAALPIVCVALVNDTVGTLASCALEDPRCQIAAIVGTGSNAAYVERRSSMERYSDSLAGVSDGGPDGPVVVNTEWGNFGADGCLDRFQTDFDREIDKKSLNPGFQVFEKLISGMYLGEIVRLAIKSLVDDGIIFGGRMPESLVQPMTFLTKYLSEIERDPPKHYYSTDQLLTVDLGLKLVHPIEAVIVRSICEAVSTRSAFLVATGIASLLKRIKPSGHVTVGIDGSLFKFHPHFPERMTRKVQELCPDYEFTLKLSEDGSGKGAAAIAALV